jgi:hypothetical protein
VSARIKAASRGSIWCFSVPLGYAYRRLKTSVLDLLAFVLWCDVTKAHTTMTWITKQHCSHLLTGKNPIESYLRWTQHWYYMWVALTISARLQTTLALRLPGSWVINTPRCHAMVEWTIFLLFITCLVLNVSVTEKRYWALFYMPLYRFLHNLLHVLVQIANKMWLQTIKRISSLLNDKSGFPCTSTCLTRLFKPSRIQWRL